MKVTKVKSKKTGSTYNVCDPTVDTAVAQAEAAAAQAAQNALTTANTAALTYHLLGIENVPLYSQSSAYMKDDIVRKTPAGETKDHVYRANDDIAAGTVWDDNDWTDTSMWGEIAHMKAGALTAETVRVYVKTVAFGLQEPKPGITVTVSYDNGASTLTQVSDQDGACEFSIPTQTPYVIRCSTTVNGYYVPAAKSFVANMSLRRVNFNYQLQQAGLKIVDVNGVEYTKDEWAAGLADESLSNTNAVAVKFYSSSGHYAIAKNYISPIGSIAWTQSPLQSLLLTGTDTATWGEDISAVYNYGSAPTSGMNNTGHTSSTSGVIQSDYSSEDATSQLINLGKLYQQLHPNYASAGTYYSIYDDEGNLLAREPYLTSAAALARTVAVTVAGSVYHGNLPSAGALLNAYVNKSAIQEALALIRGEESVTILPNGTYFWSSSQYSAYSAWSLGNGALSGNGKSYSGSVLPFFDL